MLLQLCPECKRAFFSKVIEFAIILRSLLDSPKNMHKSVFGCILEASSCSKLIQLWRRYGLIVDAYHFLRCLSGSLPLKLDITWRIAYGIRYQSQPFQIYVYFSPTLLSSYLLNYQSEFDRNLIRTLLCIWTSNDTLSLYHKDLISLNNTWSIWVCKYGVIMWP